MLSIYTWMRAEMCKGVNCFLLFTFLNKYQKAFRTISGTQHENDTSTACDSMCGTRFRTSNMQVPDVDRRRRHILSF
jgi:hypothetical protein